MHYLMLALFLLASTVATAQQRAFDLTGAVYLLNEDGTYDKLSEAQQDGMINFHFDAAQDDGRKGCKLRLVMTNSTNATVRFLRIYFEVFSRRANESIGFAFGGRLPSAAIAPGGSDQYERTFEKSTCKAITGIEPDFRYGRGGADDFHVDGLSASDTIKLFNYPDMGVLKISKSSE